MSQPSSVVATKDSWKILAQPSLRVALPVSASYTHQEFENIRRGFIPEEMEDKWFIYFEQPWLLFHRSWTGASIYGIRFTVSETGVSIVEAWASRDTEFYRGTRIDHDATAVTHLIETLLLQRWGG